MSSESLQPAPRLKPGSWQVWLLAARPRTLPAALAPIAVGTALAWEDRAFHLPSACAALAVALLLQIAANFANDAFDHARGADSDARLGPPRVTQLGLLSYRAVLFGTALTTTLAVCAGFYLVYRGGWPLLLAGMLAILALLAYTGGPYPLGYHGFGELTVFLFFGVLGVAGSYYVQALALPPPVLYLSIPVGLLTAAILVVNNLRDIVTDAGAGKRTIAVRLGRSGSVAEYGVLLLGAFTIPPVLWLGGHLSIWWALTWLCLPPAWMLIERVRRESGRMLNMRLAQTAQLTLGYCLLLSLAVIL